jgi:antitoxin HicB
MRFVYPIETEQDEQIVLVRFPDFPEALTQVDMGEEVLEGVAHDCLVAAMRSYISDRQPIPRPSAIGKRPAIALDALESAKVALAMAMQERKLSNVALAKRLKVTELIVRRMLDLDHRNHIGQIERALHELGKRLDVSVKAA